MPEWLDWQHISERHKFVQIDDNPNCASCGKPMEGHWFPSRNPQEVLDQANKVVEDYENRKLLE